MATGKQNQKQSKRDGKKEEATGREIHKIREEQQTT
jgi:hypothetical protein